MTPYELMLAVEEYQDRQRIENEARIVQAYMTASLARSKHMPSLRQVLRDFDAKSRRREQTPEEMLAIVKMLHWKIEKGGGR